MLILSLFAFVSGIVTLISPCVLPLLPVILSGSVRGGRARPLGIVAGFTLGFGALSILLSAAVQTLGLGDGTLRIAALVVFLAFGLVLLVPALGALFERFSASLSGRLRPRGRAGAGRRATGFWSGIPVGLSLGIVWAPCVGPIMGSVLGLAATRRLDGGAVLIALSYTLGSSLGMLAVMLGGKALAARVPVLARRAAGIQRLFGLLLVVVALALALGLDRRFEAGVLAAFPKLGSGLTAIESSGPARDALDARSARTAGGGAMTGAAMTGTAGGMAGDGAFKGIGSAPENGALGDFGKAPELVPGGSWLGSGPLTMASLRGKVVLVDFWTYSCVNCLRTLPWLRAMERAYKESGLVVIGVHSPEFAFEKDRGNVERAMRDLGVDWPVMQDNDYATWFAYKNRYWPAHYFIDAKGRVRYAHYGEGGYEDGEGVIRALLAEAGLSPAAAASVAAAAAPPANASVPGALPAADLTPETYLGSLRATGRTTAYTAGSGEWRLEGQWKTSEEYIESAAPVGGTATLELGFRAAKVFLVLEGAGAGASMSVLVDGKKAGDGPDISGGELRPAGSRLYTIVSGADGALHRLRLEARGRIRLYAFTFG